MDRLNQLKSESGGSRDLTLDTSSPPSESFMTANESSSKYFSLSEVDSTFDVSPTKDSATSTSGQNLSDSEVIPNLSPIPKKVESFQIGKQIEAANILSGGVNIFDDNDNSYDGDELVIDDNVPIEESGKNDDEHPFEKNVGSVENLANVAEAIPSIDTEVVLQIDGKNVNAIAIGNGLYLYRKGIEELAAIQMIDDNQQQPSFKFLKVRDNAEGNLEVYEEIEVEVPNKVPAKEEKAAEKKLNVPVKDSCSHIKSTDYDTFLDNKSIKDDSLVCKSTCNKNIDLQPESKSEVNLNGKKVKLNESRKSPLISTFTPMTYHSTPNKEGIPLTKTMVDQQLHPNRQSDNIKKTIEVHTDSCKRESPLKDKDNDSMKQREPLCPSIDKSELQSDILDSKLPEGKTGEAGNIRNTEIIKIDSKIDASEKLLPIMDIIQKKIKDECKNVPEEKMSNNSKETQLKGIENQMQLGDGESNVSNEECDTKKSLILDDNNLKHNEIKPVHEQIKPAIENKEVEEVTPLNENLIESNLFGTKSDDNNKTVQISSETVPKADEIKNDDIPIMSSEENIEVDSKVIADKKQTTREKPLISNSTIENLTNEIQSLNDCNKSSDQISNKEIFSSQNFVAEIYLHCKTSQSTKDTNSSPTSSKDLKHTEVPSIGLLEHETEQKTNLSKSDCKLIDHVVMIEKGMRKENDTCKSNIQGKITGATSKNKFTKSVITDSEKTKDCYIDRDKNTTELLVDNLSENITISQKDLEIKKDGSAFSKEITQLQSKIEQPINEAKSETSKSKIAGTKSNNNYSAVPFGKWTEANRQEFLNKIKETKIPCSTSNTKQLKQPNDLNRRDILKKIDTQRQAHLITAKIQESSGHAKTSVRGDPTTAFVNKPNPSLKTNDEQKVSVSLIDSSKNRPLTSTITFEEKYIENNESLNTININKIPARRKEINNQDLIDKTIEGIISRAVSTKPHEEWKQTIKMDAAEALKHHNSLISLDEIEKKMNELHGIPFVERPAHELPQVHVEKINEKPKDTKSNTQHLLCKKNKDVVGENVSDEEIIEHQPVTGDMTSNNSTMSSQEKLPADNNEEKKKEKIITEKDFDKFARRNSITYENCLTVKFDGRESHNVIQTLVEKEVPCKKLTRNEMMLAESKAKSTNKHLMMRHNINSTKTVSAAKGTSEEDLFNKNYQSQSKVQLAYQSAITAKRQLECPVLEDKPVKAIFLESGSDFATVPLNVQGQELSPAKKIVLDSDSQSASESLDSDVIDFPYEAKLQDESKSKSKHQRKQVLTPVDIPELELIEPSDLGINESPKKRKKHDETKEKAKTIAPKKSYLLNRATVADKINLANSEIRSNDAGSDSKPFVHSAAISAIDNLVKAAELIETQSEKKTQVINLQGSDASSLSTPTKRGRGRPRKYPLSETSQHINKTPIPKKPRLIDSNTSKKVVEFEDSDSNEEFIKENWTMGKINENIVCPICNKLFRSENVVFKHVKHCTGPSPNRSESSRSLRKFSQSEGKSGDSDSNFSDESEDEKPIKPKAKVTKSIQMKKDDIIVIEDTPQKKISEGVKLRENSKPIKLIKKSDNLVCEFCGKTFRQLSYLVNHKQQQHKKEEKHLQKDAISINNSSLTVFSCEVCKKEFRKLHHLVQHRIIHNSNLMTSRLSRKTSNDKNEISSVSDIKRAKHNEDQSAGFRCEPCDKSFRKLHHLVEHRETHDGINKKVSINNGPSSSEAVCKKSFKRLQQLNEHSEQHCDSSSDKSDDVKSVKSSLSTKDIIHECSLCYMVFPNEHSLNKHTIICLRKKKQSAAKQAKLLEQKEKNGEDILEDEDNDSDIQNQSDKECETESNHKGENLNKSTDKSDTITQQTDMSNEKKGDVGKTETVDIKPEELHVVSDKVENSCLKRSIKEEEKLEKPDDKNCKKHSKIRKIEIITILESPKKKINNVKEKRMSTEIKRPRSTVAPLDVKNGNSTDISDDDEIRYMLNPNMKEDVPEEKIFMKVRSNKRSSLQFERPNSKDLVKRRISLQNLPKVQRGRSKLMENKSFKPKTDKTSETQVKTEQTDSDDSDVKYSFPVSNSQNNEKDKIKTAKKDSAVQRHKTNAGVARRKSLAKHKIPVVSQKIKRRTTEVEHRCDCGQLFSSAALLSRHTTLAHTPPRVRRQRDPPPDQPQTKVPSRASEEKRKTLADQGKVSVQQKKSVVSTNVVTGKTRKSVVDNKISSKIVKSESNAKTLRSAANKGVYLCGKK